MSKLIIVESPSKAKTISKILGDEYKVVACNGHLVDLPKNKLGVDKQNGFAADYTVDKFKGKIVKLLKDEASKSEEVFLASDPDREGEAISYHIANLLGINGKIRIEFNEITSKAIKSAVQNPRDIDINRVNAQQTRRILDRLVGYEISPLLWKKLGYTTSAGRVQSVALKLICILEDSIKKFIPEKYWSVNGTFDNLKLDLYKISDKKADKVMDKSLLDHLETLIGSDFKLIENNIVSKKSSPSLPFKTSSLQQAASSELGFSPSRTMNIAQTLYSGIEIDDSLIGLITYMRTDSVRISDEAVSESKKYIEKEFGAKYHQYRKTAEKKKNEQDAHEAIRPTSVLRSPDKIKRYLKDDQYKLYKLIYSRFLASQMADAKYDQLEVVLEKDNYLFRDLFNKITFDGHLKVLNNNENNYIDEFPKVKESMKLKELDIKESETKPEPRYTEASLIKKLEKEGIGRPSTYSTIVETLKEKEYVELKEKKFIPTNLGYAVKDILDINFPNIMNVKFTSEMEDSLDKVEQGEQNWVDILKSFDKDLSKYIEAYKQNSQNEKKEVETDLKCDECQQMMFLKRGRFGLYAECANKHKRSVPNGTVDYEEEKSGFVNLSKVVSQEDTKRKGIKTDVLIDGEVAILKVGPYGHYLEVEINGEKKREAIPKNVKIPDKTDSVVLLKDQLDKIKDRNKSIENSAEPCEKCGSKMLVKLGKWGPFLSCSGYPNCKNIRKYSKKTEK